MLKGDGNMKDKMKKFLRPCGGFSDNFIISALLSVIIVYIGGILSLFLFGFLDIEEKLIAWTGSDNLGTFLTNYLFTIGVWIAGLLFIAIPKKNRPMLKALKSNRTANNLKGIIIGLLLGFGTNGFCVLMSVITGDIKLSYSGINPVLLLAFIIAVFIQSSSEELTDRIYLYQKLRRRYRNPLVAILFSAAVFMAMHMTNPGFTVVAGSQIFLVGVIWALIVYYYDSVWVAFWFHAAWNFTQNIIFGLPNSGIVSEYSIFKLEAASARDGLFYNVNFGVEGSIGSSLILIVVIIVLVVINRGKTEKKDYWADAEKKAAEKLEAAA